MTPEQKLEKLGLKLPTVPTPVANYVPFKRDGNTVYLSGQGPRRPDGSMCTGKVGRDVTIEQAYEHARLVGLGLLATARSTRKYCAASTTPSSSPGFLASSA